MKKYLIVTFDVCNMGGGQLFVLRRAKHLINAGFDVHIVVTYHSDYYPLEEQFKGIPLYVIPKMGKYAALNTLKEQNRIIDDLLLRIGDTNGMYIESHDFTTTEWGELIAAKCNGKHLCYPLAEKKIKYYKLQPGKSIFEKKLQKGEFYGCSSVSLKLIFERKDVPHNYVNIGFDESELEEQCTPSIPYQRKAGDYVITTVTRLTKKYIEHLADATAELAKNNPEKHFVLLICGGCKIPGREDFLKKNYNTEKYGLHNLIIIYTGYIDKLGKDIFMMSDVFVGMATASINAISQKCLTINIDPRFGIKYASGFFGVDTKNFAFAEDDKVYTIFEKLNEAFTMDAEKRNKYVMLGRKCYEEEFEMNSCFKQMDNIFPSMAEVKMNSSLKIPFLYRFAVRLAYWIKWNIIKSH